MAGAEWPPLREVTETSLAERTSGREKVEQVTIPIRVTKSQKRVRFVLDFVVTPFLFLALICAGLLVSGRAPWFFAKAKEITEEGTHPGMGGWEVPCVDFRGVAVDPQSPSPVGTQVRIMAYCDTECTWRAVIRIDGKMVAWSSLDRFDYVWDTAGYPAGEHTVSVRFISPLLQSDPPVTRQMTYLLVDTKAHQP